MSVCRLHTHVVCLCCLLLLSLVCRQVAQLSKQLDNREYERLRDREHYRVENEHLQKELEVLQQELSSKLTEFADLMDVNIRLDKEISRYHRLLREHEKK